MFNVTRNKRSLRVNSGNRQGMQYSEKNEHKTDKNVTCSYKDSVLQVTFYASQSHIWAVHIYIYMSFGSEVVITRAVVGGPAMT